jgi:hypothetical protein
MPRKNHPPPELTDAELAELPRRGDDFHDPEWEATYKEAMKAHRKAQAERRKGIIRPKLPDDPF